MIVSEKEFEKEKKYLDKTISVIQKQIQGKEEQALEYKNMVIENKRFIYNNTHEMSDVEYVSMMNEQDFNIDIINKDIVKVYKLYRSLETPYFGKVIFNGEELYIGLTGIEEDEENLVYDWRAPISNLYYNFERGKAFYDTPEGKIDGEITLKRHFKIEMGNLVQCYDNDIQIDDEILQEVLMKSSDEKMSAIVNTIQKEQNEIIRYTGKRNLIIDGVAGSGKTSVALHRIAYLIYKEKDLTENNVLIFSPNDVFINYISNVLPELGENNARCTTMSDFAKAYITGTKLESLSEFIERCYNANIDETNINLIKTKMSGMYQNTLDEYLEYFTKNICFTKSMGLKKTKLSSQELNELFHKAASKLSFSDKLNYMTEKLCDIFKIDGDKNFSKMLTTLKKLLHLKDNPLDIFEDFKRYQEKDALYELNREIINYEDIYGMLYLYFELRGYPIVSDIKHIVIDEVQDYTYLELSLLKKVFKSATFTILGDKNQIINPYLKYHTLDELSDIFNNSKYLELKKAYRSSFEIVNYSNSILEINDVKPIRRKSDTDIIFKKETDLKKNLEEDISNFKNQGYKRIAIITKDEDETKMIYNLIKSKKVGLITDSILKEIVVLPSYLSKGLEFDAVIAYTKNNNKYKNEEKYLYYVVVTRAQHALIIYNQK